VEVQSRAGFRQEQRLSGGTAGTIATWKRVQKIYWSWNWVRTAALDSQLPHRVPSHSILNNLYGGNLHNRCPIICQRGGSARRITIAWGGDDNAVAMRWHGGHIFAVNLWGLYCTVDRSKWHPRCHSHDPQTHRPPRLQLKLRSRLLLLDISGHPQRNGRSAS